MHNAPITYEILQEEPPGRLCKNGPHVASFFFINKEGIKVPNRFLKVSGSFIAKDLRGVYCEYCLSVATALAKEKRNGNA